VKGSSNAFPDKGVTEKDPDVGGELITTTTEDLVVTVLESTLI